MKRELASICSSERYASIISLFAAALPMPIPIYDNHIHLRPDGECIAALRRFRRAGGTGLTLVNLPYPHIPVEGAEAFNREYELTFRLAVRAREETGLKVNVAVGPYPVTFLSLRDAIGAERAEEEMRKALDNAIKSVYDGRAQAIGEVGRPHFPVDGEAMNASNRILSYAMELAADADCPVIIHSEHADVAVMKEFADMAEAAGLPRGKVIKHLSSPLVLETENHGIMPSIPASRSALREALSKGGDFLMETDYIDDPARPGAAMDVVSVPKRIKGFMQSGELDERTVWRIGEEIPARLYGVR